MGIARARSAVPAVCAAILAMMAVSATASAATKPYSLVICALGASEQPGDAGVGCGPNQPAGVPASVTASATDPGVAMTATFLNENKSGSGINLGSANLTPPAGFTVASASVSGVAPFVCPSSCTAPVVGNVVQLRGVAVPPGSAITVAMKVGTPPPTTVCTVRSPCGWSVLAKQSNDFSGAPGNNLNVDSATSALNTVLAQLQFGAQPHSARLGQAITDSDYNPPPAPPPAIGGTGGPVKVKVADSTGAEISSYHGAVSLALNTPGNTSTNPTPATLSGTECASPPTATCTTNAAGGVATFADLIVSNAGNGFTLTASTTATDLLPSTSSALFNVQQDGAQCTTNKSCHTEAKSANFVTTDGGVDASVTATFGQPTNLSESLDFGVHMPATQCEGYDAPHDVYWNFPPGTTGTTTTSITTTVLSGNISGSMINGQDNCLSAPVQFIELNESVTPKMLSPAPATTTQPDGTSGGFSGLLADCGSKNLQVDPKSQPCVSSRTGTSNPLGGGTLTITISVPASFGDMTSRG